MVVVFLGQITTCDIFLFQTSSLSHAIQDGQSQVMNLFCSIDFPIQLGPSSIKNVQLVGQSYSFVKRKGTTKGQHDTSFMDGGPYRRMTSFLLPDTLPSHKTDTFSRGQNFFHYCCPLLWCGQIANSTHMINSRVM